MWCCGSLRQPPFSATGSSSRFCTRRMYFLYLNFFRCYFFKLGFLFVFLYAFSNNIWNLFSCFNIVFALFFFSSFFLFSLSIIVLFLFFYFLLFSICIFVFLSSWMLAINVVSIYSQQWIAWWRHQLDSRIWCDDRRRKSTANVVNEYKHLIQKKRHPQTHQHAFINHVRTFAHT